MNSFIKILSALSVLLVAATSWAAQKPMCEVILKTEVDMRVRIIPVGDTPPPVSRYEFEMNNARWSAEIEYGTVSAQILIKRESQIQFVLPLDGAQDGLRTAHFTLTEGDQGLLALESREKIHVFVIHDAGIEHSGVQERK